MKVEQVKKNHPWKNHCWDKAVKSNYKIETDAGFSDQFGNSQTIEHFFLVV
jgi:hypothetical protein